MRERGQTVLAVSIDGQAAGLIAVADPIRAGSAEAVRALKDAGLRIVMLTGDHRATADAIAREIGDREVAALSELNLGSLAMTRGEMQHAREHFLQALKEMLALNLKEKFT